ncbi:hypothetical protein ERX27_04160 [Macrococcus brunensis]|uniref:Uncharacterized protein n=1 Tax=Macrococcus brunensis TaxID=198483 RepID=A0A4R6BES9_9STAP|nr:hypothetical protein [Macrococcus brunensis]TDL98340.1 hypothetical protein ERX27_04160 [Macrococcus brunensis]ULG71519.1 hypothetical protein MGG12_09445 [Macrococcus brunensis]ULG73783.1 hypothetical protein MGG13_08965 [Macrococcus brunensis]
MNELITYFPYMIKNTIIELRYNLKQYVWWLLFNLSIIFLSVFLMNLFSPTETDKSRLLFQLSGYLLFFWVAGALYFSSSILSRRGFILNITSLPLYVLINVQIINFLLQFMMSFVFLLVIALTNHIHMTPSTLGVFYFLVLTYLILIPVGLILSLLKYYSRNMKRNMILILTVLMISVSILWVPTQLPALAIKVLSLNPFYFLVNGFQSSVVLGQVAFYNIPLHLLFFCELVLLYIWTFYFYKKLKDEINKK